MVAAEVVELIPMASAHSWASTSMKNWRPLTGPAKSTWILSQGREGHIQGWRGAEGGFALFS